MPIYFVEIVVTALLAAAFITQVFVPLWYGTPLVPVFRKRKLDSELSHAREDIEVAEEENLIASLKEEAAVLRGEVEVEQEEEEDQTK